jgi:hypothetical protein
MATAGKGTSINKIIKIADEQMYLEKEERKLHREMQPNSNQISLFH